MAPQQAAPQTAGRRRSRAGKKKASGDDTALLLFGDAFVTALWVMISSLFAEVSTSSFHDTLHTCLVVDGPCMPPSVLLFALLFPLRACPFHGSCTTWQGPPNPHPCFSLCVCLSNMSGLDSRTLHRPYRDPAVFTISTLSTLHHSALPLLWPLPCKHCRAAETLHEISGLGVSLPWIVSCHALFSLSRCAPPSCL
jgi:hypothetical protein